MTPFLTATALACHTCAWASNVSANLRDVLILLGWAAAAGAIVAANGGA